MNNELKKIKTFALYPWDMVNDSLKREEYALAGYGILVQILMLVFVLPVAIVVYIPLYIMGWITEWVIDNNE